MNLERDNSSGLPSKIGFVLSPSPLDRLEGLPEELFESLVDPLMDLGHSVDASLPEPIKDLEQKNHQEILSYFFNSSAFRVQENFTFQSIPINIASHSFLHLSVLEAFFEENFIEESLLGVLWIDSSFRLKESLEPIDSINETSLGALLSPGQSELRSSLGLSFSYQFNNKQIIHLAGSKPSLVKPTFKYYSMDVLQEFGLTRAIEDINDELKVFDKVLVVWDLSSISSSLLDGRLSIKEVLQIANWIDQSLRRKNKLLALSLSGYEDLALDYKDLQTLMRRIILRIFGKTLFN